MTAGEQPDQHPLDQPVLTDDHALDLEDGALQHFALAGGARHALVRHALIRQVLIGQALIHALIRRALIRLGHGVQKTAITV